MNFPRLSGVFTSGSFLYRQVYKAREQKDLVVSLKMCPCDPGSNPDNSDGNSRHCLLIFAVTEARLPLAGHEERGGRVQVGLLI